MFNKEITKYFFLLITGVVGLIIFAIIENIDFSFGEFQGHSITTGLFGLSLFIIGFSTASLKNIAIHNSNAVAPKDTNNKR